MPLADPVPSRRSQRANLSSTYRTVTAVTAQQQQHPGTSQADSDENGIAQSDERASKQCADIASNGQQQTAAASLQAQQSLSLSTATAAAERTALAAIGNIQQNTQTQQAQLQLSAPGPIMANTRSDAYGAVAPTVNNIAAAHAAISAASEPSAAVTENDRSAPGPTNGAAASNTIAAATAVTNPAAAVTDNAAAAAAAVANNGRAIAVDGTNGATMATSNARIAPASAANMAIVPLAGVNAASSSGADQGQTDVFFDLPPKDAEYLRGIVGDLGSIRGCWDVDKLVSTNSTLLCALMEVNRELGVKSAALKRVESAVPQMANLFNTQGAAMKAQFKSLQAVLTGSKPRARTITVQTEYETWVLTAARETALP